MRFVKISKVLLLLASAVFAVGCVGEDPDTEEVQEQSDELSEQAIEREGRRVDVLAIDFAGEGEGSTFDAPGLERAEPTPTPWDPGIQPPPEPEPSPGYDTISPEPT
jgi:PBP1b-binding outer membrane lipoprotein LpoB